MASADCWRRAGIPSDPWPAACLARVSSVATASRRCPPKRPSAASVDGLLMSMPRDCRASMAKSPLAWTYCVLLQSDEERRCGEARRSSNRVVCIRGEDRTLLDGILGADRRQERGVAPGQVADALLVAGRGVELLAELEMIAVKHDRLQHL